MQSVYAMLHVVLVVAYLAAPPLLVVLGVVLVVRARRAGRSTAAAIVPVVSTLIAGAAIGMSLAMIYAWVIGRSVTAISIGQVLLAAYAGMGLLSILKGLDWLLQQAIGAVRRRRGWEGPSAASLALFVRFVFLVLVLLPFSMAATMTYRPKVVPSHTPATEIGVGYQDVRFEAADGTRLAAWWIPAPALRQGSPDETAVVVHGLGSGKADMLHMAGALHAAGYNVLVLDLRAHGQSGGQLSSFGVSERLDVEAAARWVREMRPSSSRRLVALGASMGAAATLAARDATGQSPFDAIAVLGTYDDLGRMAATVIRRQFWGPLATVARWTAVPAASAHAGEDLASFRPAEAARGVWPRPLLVVHGEADEIIPFRSGVRLYESALEPKRSWWLPDLDHNGVLGAPGTMEVVLQFYEDARRVPRGIA